MVVVVAELEPQDYLEDPGAAATAVDILEVLAIKVIMVGQAVVLIPAAGAGVLARLAPLLLMVLQEELEEPVLLTQ
jgi:hypothetical protein